MPDDPSISPNDEGLDGIDRHPRPAPAPNPPTPAPVDEGLASWAKVVQSAIAAQAGVEMMGTTSSSVHFKFRGQEFSVHVRRVS